MTQGRSERMHILPVFSYKKIEEDDYIKELAVGFVSNTNASHSASEVSGDGGYAIWQTPWGKTACRVLNVHFASRNSGNLWQSNAGVQLSGLLTFRRLSLHLEGRGNTPLQGAMSG